MKSELWSAEAKKGLSLFFLPNGCVDGPTSPPELIPKQPGYKL